MRFTIRSLGSPTPSPLSYYFVSVCLIIGVGVPMWISWYEFPSHVRPFIRQGSGRDAQTNINLSKTNEAMPQKWLSHNDIICYKYLFDDFVSAIVQESNNPTFSCDKQCLKALNLSSRLLFDNLGFYYRSIIVEYLPIIQALIILDCRVINLIYQR